MPQQPLVHMGGKYKKSRICVKESLFDTRQLGRAGIKFVEINCLQLWQSPEEVS